MEKICFNFYNYRCVELENYYSAHGHTVKISAVGTQPFFDKNCTIFTGKEGLENFRLSPLFSKAQCDGIIAVLDEITPSDCGKAVENGIGKIITEKNLLEHRDVPLKFKNSGKLTSDNVHILDFGDRSVRIIVQLLETYGVDYHLHGSYSSILDVMEREKDIFVLLNLGGSEFDINGFVKKAQIIPEIKQIPVIPFKDTKNGVTTSELNCGLNKIAKVILSSNEILSLLSVLLVKKDFHSAICSSLEKLDISQLFSSKSLRQLYFQPESEFFSLEHPHLSCDFAGIFRQMERIGSVFYRMMLFEWMAILS